MHHLLPVMALLMQLSLHAQIDPKKLDSLSRSIDSSAKAYKSWQDSFVIMQDSIYHDAIDNNENNTRNPGQFLAEQKKKEKQRDQVMLRIVIIAVFLIAGLIALLWRRKTKI